MVSTNQEDRREVLGQCVQPGHVQGTGHCPFSCQRHTPIRQRERERAFGVSQITEPAKGDITQTESSLNCVMHFSDSCAITFPALTLQI